MLARGPRPRPPAPFAREAAAAGLTLPKGQAYNAPQSVWCFLRWMRVAKKPELPGFREKRRILFGEKTTPEQMRNTGRLFMEVERYDEALDFFERTDAEAEVREIAGVAFERGDVPLFLRAKLILKEQPTEQELSAIARTAESAGRRSMAYVAHLKAGHTEQAERLRTELLGGSEAGARPAPAAEKADRAEGAGNA